MTRFLVAACCVLVHLSASAQFFQRPTRKPPAGGNCGLEQAADCQINVQIFDFGRGQMTPTAPDINGNNTVSVTCTRAPRHEGIDVQVDFYLRALPAEPNRYMRDSHLLYLRYHMYVDPARTRYWGDGIAGGTFPFQGTLFLDNRNRVGTLVFPVYGKVPGAQSQTLPGQWLGAVVTQLEYQVSCR